MNLSDAVHAKLRKIDKSFEGTEFWARKKLGSYSMLCIFYIYNVSAY